MSTDLESNKIEQVWPALPSTYKIKFFARYPLASCQGKNEHIIRRRSHLLLPPCFVFVLPAFSSLVNWTKIFNDKLFHLVSLK